MSIKLIKHNPPGRDRRLQFKLKALVLDELLAVPHGLTSLEVYERVRVKLPIDYQIDYHTVKSAISRYTLTKSIVPVVSAPASRRRLYRHPFNAQLMDVDANQAAAPPLAGLALQLIRHMPIKEYGYEGGREAFYQPRKLDRYDYLASRNSFLPVRLYEPHLNIAPGEVGVYNGVRWTINDQPS